MKTNLIRLFISLVLALQSCTSSDYTIETAVAGTLTAFPIPTPRKTIAPVPTKTPAHTSTPPSRLDLAGISLDYYKGLLQRKGFVFYREDGNPGYRTVVGRYKSFSATWVILDEYQYILFRAEYGFQPSLVNEALDQIPHGIDFVLMVLGDQITKEELDNWISGPDDFLCFSGLVIYSNHITFTDEYMMTIMLERDWDENYQTIYGSCS